MQVFIFITIITVGILIYNFNIVSYFDLNKLSKNEDKDQESINKNSNLKR